MFNQKSLYAVVRAVGFGLLLLTAVDFLATLVPPSFTNPNWELATAGRFIDLAWAPLLGFILILSSPPDESQEVADEEIGWRRFLTPSRWRWTLRVCSYLPLALGILYFLMVPLMVVNGFRIQNRNRTEFNLLVETQQRQLAAGQAEISQLPVEQLLPLYQSLTGPNPSSVDTRPDALRAEISGLLKRNADQAKTEAERNLREVQTNVFRSVIKWVIGAVVAGTLLIYLWQFPAWWRFLP